MFDVLRMGRDFLCILDNFKGVFKIKDLITHNKSNTISAEGFDEYRSIGFSIHKVLRIPFYYEKTIPRIPPIRLHRT